MLSRNQTVVVSIAAILAMVVAVTFAVQAQTPPKKPPAVYTGIVAGVAVGGYDPVAYFVDGRPVKGAASITLEHQGAIWRFASIANRDLFKADPAKYAPQYGGHCAWAVAEGYTAKGDPTAWTIADGRLYLNYNRAVQLNWEKDIAGNVRRGDGHWPKLTGAP
jgi:YHS domain-containing protein